MRGGAMGTAKPSDETVGGAIGGGGDGTSSSSSANKVNVQTPWDKTKTDGTSAKFSILYYIPLA